MFSGVTSSARSPSQTKMMTRRAVDPASCCATPRPPRGPSTTNDKALKIKKYSYFHGCPRFSIMRECGWDEVFFMRSPSPSARCCLTLSRHPTPDIEQPLTMGNLIKPANGFPKQAKDFNLHVVETYNEVLELALHRHADTMNPFQELEHPTQGGSLGWLVDLVGERLVLTSQLLAQSALRHRIDQQR